MQIETPPAVKPYEKPEGERRGLVIVHTGEGKGKTTAAFGLALRAHGRHHIHGRTVAIWRFAPTPAARLGEQRVFERIGIPIEAVGDGDDGLARDGWERARTSILSGVHFLVVLDGITDLLTEGRLPLDDVLATLRARPSDAHVVLTGRRCPPALIERADTVTEMTVLKQAAGAGAPARPGTGN
ncbi:MAG: cob(I)yrinic acid a,c-diamide adenosyltransferase [Variovorax sp.]|jgi:cob(I)alamin adenosyltransferase|nr:MAG: cob(I)yrinic acid a,c-diamide adenosyltransferase [Variovorax sp.]